MRRLFLGLATAAVAVSAFAATDTANATPFHLIRWQDSGFCQIWDQSIPTTPWPANYTVVSEEMPTFEAAFVLKTGLLQSGACSF
ncbi:hypothetical protein ACFFWD_16635 [Bradyrhizobium erythrophlei]|uniref:hypothetical protein n=1 Tax=Bradyrhizobium erythrophlei TaxID=1437360 RepID=UPI0035EBACD8